MRTLLTFLLILPLFSLVASAQSSSSIQGRIMDTLEKKPVQNAVISLLHKKDSTLVQFCRSNSEGQFLLNELPAGEYVYLITYPKFADFAEELQLTAGEHKTIATIAMTHKSELLKEVVVRGGAAIRIKGDTTEFTADSFAVREGATVEDLLKKLPGFQVNSKGEITAQGKNIDKVLVEGEEFFGDDPTMATQNIAAKAVDKVQIFETKSDQQQLTGISTGNEGKTLNIKLKEDSKKGAFAKVNGGTDFTKYYDAKLVYNRFVGKEKISVYGTRTNLNTGSLNWEDQQKLGIENDYEYDEISGFYFSSSDNSDFNDWNFKGLPNSYTAGGLYINKWNSDKQSVNGSYRYNRLGTINNSSKFVQSILNNTINYRNTYTNSNGFNQQHAFNAKYEWKLDSLTSFKFTTANLRKNSENMNETDGEYLNNEKEFINTSDQSRHTYTMRHQSTNVLTYKQLFTKKNRQLLATLRYGLITDDNNGIYITKTEFYKNGIVDSSDLTDQKKTFIGNANNFGSKITYTEPLTNKWNAVLDYSFNESKSNSNRNTFNQTSNGKYENFDPYYSNHFRLNAVSNSGTMIFRFIDKKFKSSFGTGISELQLHLNDLDSSKRNTYSFLKLTPQAQFSYMPKAQTNISLTYRGNTRQPTIDQLQPIRDNSDNLNVFVGNPNLKVAFQHYFSLFFNQFKVLSSRYLYGNVFYNITNNAITNYTFVDTVRGKQVYTPINVAGNRNWGYYLDWDKEGGEKKLGYGVYSNANGGRNSNYINQNNVKILNRTNYAYYTIGFSVNYQEEQKKSFSARPNISYNISKSSLQPDVVTKYFQYGGYVDGYAKLYWGLELTTNANFQLRQKLPQFPGNSNFIIWNAELAKKVFKKKNGKIMLSVNDILNQNKGFNRIIESNFIQEERYSRVSRYALLKFEYTFNKMPGTK